MKRNAITSAIALAFGLTGPVWATGSTDNLDNGSVSATVSSLAGGASVDASRNRADQSAEAVAQSIDAVDATGSNAIDDSYNGWKGIAQNAQESGAQSQTQQNVALQVSEDGEGGTTASAEDQSTSVAIGLSGALNVANQGGAVGENTIGIALTGANAITDSYKNWKGLSQNAQNTGVQSLTQQNIALQVNENEGATTASADDQSQATAIGLSAALNVANQEGVVLGNAAAIAETGANAITDSYNDWKGLSQNAQNTGVQSLTQQNIALQVNENGQGGTAASADNQSEAVAVGLSAALNVANQEGEVFANAAAIAFTGANAISSSHNEWKGLSQNAQNTGVQSLTQQNVALQANESGGATTASAGDQSLAAAVGLSGALNVANQEGAVLGNAAVIALTGANAITDSYNDWKGLSQNAQNTGVQSLIQQNAAVQVNDDGEGATTANAEGQSLAVALDLSGTRNVALQTGAVEFNAATAGLTGDNTITNSFNGWKGISMNAQNTGVQSLIQQNAAVQVNGGGQEIEAVGADGSLALALNVDLAGNVAAQGGYVGGNTLEGEVQTGNNSISGSGSFNGWSGISQSVQNSGIQSLVQQNVAVQVNH